MNVIVDLEELGKLATTCDATVHAISFERSILHDIHVPNIREINLLGNDEQWQENVHSLFEWIGMAGIGSQRSASSRLHNIALIS